MKVKQNINILLKILKNGLEGCDDPKSFIKHSNDMQHVYKILKSTTQIENVKY